MIHLDLPPEVLEQVSPIVEGHRDGLNARGVRIEPTAHVQAVRRPGGDYEVTGPTRRSFARSPIEAQRQVLELCNGAAVEQCRDLAVHAGVVARGGRALALPATSGAGKSTIVAALVRLGWDYVSDEALVLDAAAGVRPYAKWLSLHAWTLERLHLPAPVKGESERALRPADLGRVSLAGTPLVLAHVVLLERATAGRLEPLHRAAAATAVLGLSFNHYRDPVRSLQVTVRAARTAATWRLGVADPVEAAQRLTDACD